MNGVRVIVHGESPDQTDLYGVVIGSSGKDMYMVQIEDTSPEFEEVWPDGLIEVHKDLLEVIK